VSDFAIERIHLLDLDIAPLDGESVEYACELLATGLLVQWSTLIPPIEGHDQGQSWPVIRFTGPRNQLEELRNRYAGVTGAFDAAPVNPHGNKI